MPYSFTCSNCGKLVTTKNKIHGVTCSYACRNSYYKAFQKIVEQRKCKRCGNTFKIKPSSLRRNCNDCLYLKKSKFQLFEVPETVKAYFAGIIDGEGSISTGGRSGSLSLVVALGMSDPNVPDIMAGLYGGNVSKKMDSRYPNRRPMYTWKGFGEIGARLLRDILPYLRIKRPQAEIYLKARETVKNRPSEYDLSRRLAFANEIRSLNQNIIIDEPKRLRNVPQSHYTPGTPPKSMAEVLQRFRDREALREALGLNS